MSRRRRGGSSLHLQMGQETIYLLLTGGLFISLLLSLYILSRRGPTEQPPIVTLGEANGYTFATGSAAISPAFARQLSSVAAPRVREIADRYHAPVIEVIGHTDEVPVTRLKQSDLDKSLIPWLRGGRQEPVAGDNVGLGMARAVAVARALRGAGLDARYTIIPLSAGPLVLPGDRVTDGRDAADDQRRRRIEVRLRRPGEAVH